MASAGEIAAAALRHASGQTGGKLPDALRGLTDAQRAEVMRGANRVKGTVKRAAIKATSSKGKDTR